MWGDTTMYDTSHDSAQHSLAFFAVESYQRREISRLDWEKEKQLAKNGKTN